MIALGGVLAIGAGIGMRTGHLSDLLMTSVVKFSAQLCAKESRFKALFL